MTHDWDVSLLLSILDNLGEGVVVADQDANLVYLNRAAERIEGLGLAEAPAAEWTGRYEVFSSDGVTPCPPDSLPLVRAVRGEPSDETELVVRGGPGSPDAVRVSVTARPVLDGSGGVRGGVLTIRDVTERHRAEQALRESEHLLELFFAQSLDGFFFMMLDEPVRWDDGVDKDAVLEQVFSHHRITKVNDAMLAQYGATPEQLIGLTPRDLYAHDLAYGKAVWRQFFDAGRLHVETDERRLDGTPLRVEGDYICLYDAEGRIRGHFGIQRDVTERHRAEQRMRRSRRELRALAARLQSVREEERQRIAREIHDELGQALTGFKIDLAWLAGRLRPDQAELVEQATAIVGRVDETIATVRRIATELRPSVLDNLGLVAAIEWQAAELEKRADIAVSLDLPADLVELDDRQAASVFRMVQEALTNVVRHAGASAVAIALGVRDGELRLEIRDDGRGITAAELEGARSLGLVGLRERAVASGGRLWIRGEPGRGTTVTVHIPLGPPIDLTAETPVPG